MIEVVLQLVVERWRHRGAGLVAPLGCVELSTVELIRPDERAMGRHRAPSERTNYALTGFAELAY